MTRFILIASIIFQFHNCISQNSYEQLLSVNASGINQILISESVTGKHEVGYMYELKSNQQEFNLYLQRQFHVPYGLLKYHSMFITLDSIYLEYGNKLSFTKN